MASSRERYGYVATEELRASLGGDCSLAQAADAVATASVEATTRIDLHDSQGKYVVSVVSVGPATVSYVNMLGPRAVDFCAAAE